MHGTVTTATSPFVLAAEAMAQTASAIPTPGFVLISPSRNFVRSCTCAERETWTTVKWPWSVVERVLSMIFWCRPTPAEGPTPPPIPSTTAPGSTSCFEVKWGFELIM